MTTRSTVLITGASTGIGAIYADRFARRGHDLVLVARDKARLETLAARLRQETGAAVDILAADLTQPGDLAMVETRLREDARIETLINNAGAALAGFDRRELVTIPPLHDAARWETLNAARQALIADIRQAHVAERYRTVA
jgi:short-subunit dehydrogenase